MALSLKLCFVTTTRLCFFACQKGAARAALKKTKQLAPAPPKKWRLQLRNAGTYLLTYIVVEEVLLKLSF